jgi:hypothetical protein
VSPKLKFLAIHRRIPMRRFSPPTQLKAQDRGYLVGGVPRHVQQDLRREIIVYGN